ncbi:MAG: hypothetical protein IH975_09465 [Nitrospinae bacterium]|nr:hypothetical protein [Nitrospinota bacterium]
MNGHGKQGWSERLSRCLVLSAALAIMVALPARALPDKEPWTIKLSCEEGKLLSLEAREALAPEVFRALEEKCGLLLKGGENIPDEPVTATYEKVTLEEVIESLIRLTGLPSTLLAKVSSGALKLAVLATGTPKPRKHKATVSREERDGARDEDSDDEDVPEEALEGARRRYLLAKTDAERQVALEDLRELDEDEAEDLEDLDEEDLAEDQEEAELEQARQDFLLATTGAERQRALAILKRLDPDEAEDLLEMDADELADEREEAAIESALEKYYLAKTDLERQRAYEELKRIDPDEAEDLLD